MKNSNNRAIGLAFFALLFLQCHYDICEDMVGPGTPVCSVDAKFQADPLTGLPPLTVLLTNQSMNAHHVKWTFDDGSAASTASSPGSHLYASSGQFKLMLKAWNQDETCVDSASLTVFVGVPPTPPTANFSIENGNCAGPCVVKFTNTSTNATQIVWDFGDGTATSANEDMPQHFYQCPGDYSVKLKVTGAGNLMDSITKTVHIEATRWLNVFSQYGAGVKIRQLDDGTYFLISNKSNPANSHSEGFVIKLDEAGEIIGTPTFIGLSDFDVLYDFEITGSGIVVVVGSTFDPISGNDNVLFARVSQSGSLVQSPQTPFKFDNDDSEVITSVRETAAGDLVFSGYVQDSPTGEVDAFAAKMTFNASSLFFKNKIGGGNSETPHALALTDDGDLAIAGESLLAGSSNVDGFFLKLDDATGQKTAGVSPNPRQFGSNSFDLFFDVERNLTGGGLTLAGFTGNGVSSDLFIVPTSANGSPSGNPFIVATAEDDGAIDLLLMDDGSFVVAGFSNGNALIARVTASGNKDFYEKYGDAGDDRFFSIDQTKDCGFIACGMKAGSLYVVKTDSKGKAQ